MKSATGDAGEFLAELPDFGTIEVTTPVASLRGLSVRAFLANRLAIAGLTIVVGVVAFCFIGPLVYHTNQITTNLTQVTLPPSLHHLLGTDDEGYDVLGRLMVGGQNSLEIGFAVGLLAPLFGTIYGVVAGYTGGALDSLLMRLIDVVLAVPTLFFIIFIGSVFRPTLVVLILVISCLSWLSPARLVRAETLSLRRREFVQAATVMGGNTTHSIRRHLVPNTFGTIMVNASFQVADAILVVATLSFLGLGLPPPAATWGGMVAQGVTYAADGYWWMLWPPLVILVLVIVAFNLVGDALRDVLDPRLVSR